MSKIETAAAAITTWVNAGKPRYENIDGLLKSAQRAVSDALAYEQDFFWRGTNREAEFSDVQNGTQIISTNHVTGERERGMSVSRTLATVFCYGYKYAYKVRGTVAGNGSDGEPVLTGVEVASGLLDSDSAISGDEARAFTIRTAREIAAQSGITIDQVLWIEARQ